MGAGRSEIDPVGTERWALAASVFVGVLAVLVAAFGDACPFRGTLLQGDGTELDTMLALVCAAASLGFLHRERGSRWSRLAGAALAVVVGVTGAATLAHYVLGAHVAGVDGFPAHMSPNAATSLLVLSASLLTLDLSMRGTRHSGVYGAYLVGIFAAFALIGLLYDVTPLYRVSSYAHISPFTSGSLVLLAAGVSLARPREGLVALLLSPGAGGYAVRRLLLPAVLVPLIAGWLVLQAARADVFDAAFAVSLLMIVFLVAFTVLLLWSGGRLEAFDSERALLVHDLERAVALRDEFLSIASHELRTPLTSLQVQSQALDRLLERGDLSRLTPERLHRSMGVMRSQIAALTALVDDLLDVSRIGAGRLPLQPQSVDLAELVRDVTARLGPQASQSGCVLEVTSDAALVGLWDRGRLEQVLVNLLTNSFKYGAGRPVHVSTEQREGQAVLTVRDHGIGIAFEDQPRVFERFGRAASSAQYGGLGLGLYITREIVESHGGRVGLQSAPGQGATFTVALPLTAQPDRPSVDSPTAAA